MNEMLTARQLAEQLFRDKDEWLKEHLFSALEDCAEYIEICDLQKKIECHDIIDCVVEMNESRETLVEIVHELTGAEFVILGWVGQYGHRLYCINELKVCKKHAIEELEKLHAGCGWASNQHRKNLRKIRLLAPD